MTAPPLALITGAPGWLGSRLVEALVRGVPGARSPLGIQRRVRCLVSAGGGRRFARFARRGRDRGRGSPPTRRSPRSVREGRRGGDRFSCRGDHPPDARDAGDPERQRARDQRTSSPPRSGRAREGCPFSVSSNSPNRRRRDPRAGLRRDLSLPPVHDLRTLEAARGGDRQRRLRPRRDRDRDHPPPVVLRPAGSPRGRPASSR